MRSSRFHKIVSFRIFEIALTRVIFPSVSKRRLQIALVSAVVAALPATTRAMTLEEALAAAYSSNPQLEAQRASLRATDEEVAKALSGWRPNVSASGSYGWQQQSQTLLGPQAVQSIPQSEQITLSQPVFDGRTIPDTAHAKDLVEAGRAQLEAMEETVFLNATTAYLHVFRDMKIIEAYQIDIRNLQTIAKNANERLRLGELTKTDASQAEARMLGSQMNLAAAEQQLGVDAAAFEHVIGRPPETLVEHRAPDLPDRTKALNIALLENPGLLQSQAQVRAAGHAVDTAVGALLPSLSMQAQYGRSLDEIAPGVRENGLSIIGRLTIPLYDGGAGSAGVREAKEQRAQAISESFDAERQVREIFASTWTTLEMSRRAAELATSQANANETAYQGSVYEAQVGSRSVLDILNADQELLQSKVAAITQQQNAVVASFQVLQVMGRLDAKNLKLPVKLYDPQGHYDDDATRWFGLGN